MSRLSLRRGRILPGPLAPLPLEARPSSGLMIASFAATAVAVAGALLVLPHAGLRAPVPAQATMPAVAPDASEPVAAASRPVAAAPAAVSAGQAPSPPRAEAAPASSALVAAASPMLQSEEPATAFAPAKPVVKPADVRPASAKSAIAKQAAAAPSADDPLYRLDLLPVLKAGNRMAGFEPAQNAGPAPAKPARTASRKTMRTAGTTSEQAQP